MVQSSRKVTKEQQGEISWLLRMSRKHDKETQTSQGNRWNEEDDERAAHTEKRKRERRKRERERESVHGPGRQQDGPVRGSTGGTETAGGKKTRLKAHVLCMVVNASFAELFLITFLSPHSMVTTLAGRLLVYLRHGTYKPRIRIRRRIRTPNRAVLPMRA